MVQWPAQGHAAPTRAGLPHARGEGRGRAGGGGRGGGALMAEEGLQLMRAVLGTHRGRTVLAVALLLVWAALVAAESFRGLVVDIIDGDTLTVLRERAPEAQGSRAAGATASGGAQLRPVEVRLASI